MRRLLVTTHRWLGLATAVFLLMAGLTGAIIAWEHELDAWLNPRLYHAEGPSAPTAGGAHAWTPLALADRVERENHDMVVSYLPLGLEPGHTANVYVTGRHDPDTGQPRELEVSQLAFDPADGALQGSRLWGELSLARENVLPFLYKLHYSLHLPVAGGVETGILLMGVVAIVWVIDAFVALWIAFPNRRKWRRSLVFRVRQGGARLNFDLHRSGGVWTWLLTLTIAVTAVSMNLEDQVVRPLVSLVSEVHETPFDTRLGTVEPDPARAPLPRAQVVEIATFEARRRGIAAPAGGIFYTQTAGLYGVGFFAPGDDHADGRLGNPWLYFDAYSGAYLGEQIPGEGTAGDLFMQLQFPLHSGRLFGVAGRAAISLLGVAIAVLSVTGILIWARRRRRRAARHPAATAAPLREASS